MKSGAAGRNGQRYNNRAAQLNRVNAAAAIDFGVERLSTNSKGNFYLPVIPAHAGIQSFVTH
jgi:hypothetical protein